MTPEHHAELVRRVQQGDAEAFSALVVGFQDMAVGYAYAVLGDFHLAEDAAQEAFLDAYRHMAALREPAAFPGWLRRIVYKHCDRWIRSQGPPTSSLDDIGDEPLDGPSPEDLAGGAQMRDRLMAALGSLPDGQRSVLVLHHMGGHSLEDLGAFLGCQPGTVKKRLHDARKRLRAALETEVAGRLEGERPSRSEDFARGVVDLLHAARLGDAPRVRQLLRANPRLLRGRDMMGNTALIVAAACGREEVVALLRASGAPVDLHDAAAIGDTARLTALLDARPDRLDEFSEEGFTPLALAVHFGRLEAARLLLERGAGASTVSRHPLGVTPLHAALFGRQPQAALLLIEHGAEVNSGRGGAGMPRAGWTALHYAAAAGYHEVIARLLSKGADRAARDETGMTALEVAHQMRREESIRLLQEKEQR